MNNKELEGKLAALEVEIIESRANDVINQKASQEIHLQNMVMYGLFFKDRGVDFQLNNVRKMNYYNNNEFEYDFYFNTEENENFNQITVDIVFNSENNTAKVNRISLPSTSMNKEIDFEKNIKYHQNVVKLLEVLKDINSFIPYLQNYKILENPIETRSEFEINNDISSIKESIRIRDLKLSVGSTVMININSSKRYYRSYWVKSTIVKINKKTVHYVINYDDGKVSDVQRILLDYRYFKSVEQYKTEQKELEEKLNKPVV